MTAAKPGWASDLPGLVLAFAFLGLVGLFFGLGAAYWWIARILGWWAFALVFVGGMFFNSFATATRQVMAERRAAARKPPKVTVNFDGPAAGRAAVGRRIVEALSEYEHRNGRNWGAS